jgi:hypothetical protein
MGAAALVAIAIHRLERSERLCLSSLRLYSGFGGGLPSTSATEQAACSLGPTGSCDLPSRAASTRSRGACAPGAPGPRPGARGGVGCRGGGPPPDRPAGAARGCPRVGVNPKRLVARLRTSLRISVLKSGRAAVGVRMKVRGSGVSRRAPIGRKCRVRVSGAAQRPRARAGDPGGRPRRCAPAWIRVRAGR